MLILPKQKLVTVTETRGDEMLLAACYPLPRSLFVAMAPKLVWKVPASALTMYPISDALLLTPLILCFCLIQQSCS